MSKDRSLEFELSVPPDNLLRSDPNSARRSRRWSPKYVVLALASLALLAACSRNTQAIDIPTATVIPPTATATLTASPEA
ncbi:MAG: hypothetical protein Q7R49_05790, partial [Candidatus Daviesbacteria bacterium]|nr:hypothetical protein [Candidatus Daviesbacteria bacterium]